MRMAFNIFTKEGRLNVRRRDMFLYVRTWYQALRMILHDSGWHTLSYELRVRQDNNYEKGVK